MGNDAMSAPANIENLNLEQIAVEINKRFRRGVENAPEVGRLLILAQKKLEGTGTTFRDYCDEHFAYALSTLEVYKRLATNLDLLKPILPTIQETIPTMGIL